MAQTIKVSPNFATEKQFILAMSESNKIQNTHV